MKILEFYSGIGGCAAAAREVAAERGVSLGLAGALDQSPSAVSVHALNFPDGNARVFNLEDATAEGLASYGADLWWMSPPCQPYTRKGLRRDLADPRALSFVRLLGHLARVRPRHFALENVEGFVESEARALLRGTLEEAGYSVAERLLCPTELGVPNRRPRYYLAASLDGLAPSAREWSLRKPADRAEPWAWPLAEYLEPAERLPAEVFLPEEQVERFGPGLRIVDPSDRAAYTTCFASGYGRQLMRSGAYVLAGGRVRRFTPDEVLRLLHFPRGFRFPAELPLTKRWQLAGNSLSVLAVKEVLRALPPFSP